MERIRKQEIKDPIKRVKAETLKTNLSTESTVDDDEVKKACNSLPKSLICRNVTGLNSQISKNYGNSKL